MPTEQAVDTAALDAQLAEKLFGLLWKEGLGQPRFWYDPINMQEGQLIPEKAMQYAPLGYSTTGDGMLMVIEKLWERGYFTSFNSCYGGGYNAQVCTKEYIDGLDNAYGEDWWETGMTAPTAVALAALSALDT